MSAVTVNNRTYSDDSNPITGLGNGGHRTRLIPLFSDALTEIADQVLTASQSYRATSTSTVLIGAGSKDFVVTEGKGFAVGDLVLARHSTNASTFMVGAITAFNAMTGDLSLSVAPGDFGGSGWISAWVVSGPIGPRGLRGLAGYSYGWDVSAVAGDPGSGNIRANDAVLTSATELYLDHVDGLGVDVSAQLANWDASTSAVKGLLILRSQTDPSQQISYDVTAVASSVGYFTLTVIYRGGAASFEAGIVVDVTFSRTGDKGEKGDQGETGSITNAGDGTVTAPGFAFSSETGLGIRRKGPALATITANGTDLLELRPATLSEAQAGTNALAVMTPKRVADAITALAKANFVRTALTTGTTLTRADRGRYIDVTSGSVTLNFEDSMYFGSGWSIVIGNSGSGDVTLQPYVTDAIDGRLNLVMYPGELRLIIVDEEDLASRVLAPFRKTFTASGTFTVPPGYRAFGGLAWSGGASGIVNPAGGTRVPGGCGGGCFPFLIPTENILTSTLFFYVGAGGAASTTTTSNAGGDTWINTLFRVKGGASTGGAVSSAFNVGDGSAGAFGAGALGQSPIYGGGSPPNADADGSSSVYGGGCGGGVSTTSINLSQGLSGFAGRGGAGSVAGTPGDGVAPAGGGGSTRTGPRSGAGARGELRIWGVC